MGTKRRLLRLTKAIGREAARLAPIFEARLFSSALTRLEEPPLRLIEGQIHGSPWQELVGSKEFSTELNKIPELRELFLAIAEKGKESIKGLSLKKKTEI